MSDVIDEFQRYSFSFNVKLLGIPEMSPRKSAEETTGLCVKLFNAMGATSIAKYDIDIAHRVPSRNPSRNPKSIICKLIRRLARDDVMSLRQEARNCNLPTKKQKDSVVRMK